MKSKVAMVVFIVLSQVSVLLFQNCARTDLSGTQTETLSFSSISQVYGKDYSVLVKSQPPASLSDVDRLGMNINCNYWEMNEAALSDCVGDLDLIKSLGIGSIRWGVHWYMMTEKDGYTLTPARVKFVKAFLNEARSRGMKILFTVGLEAHQGAYQCSAVQNPPSAPSPRLDFCDDKFQKYLANILDLVLPFTAHIELFNETNWNYPANVPLYGNKYGSADFILSRSKTLYNLAHQEMIKKRQWGFSAILHSQGISYFYDHSYPEMGWNPGSLPLITAVNYLHWMKNGWQVSGQNVYDDVIGVVDVHPYFKAQEYNVMLRHFLKKTSELSPSGYKYVWITETNTDKKNNANGVVSLDEDDQLLLFQDLTWYLDNNWVQKAFWYVARGGVSSSEGDLYGIYRKDRSLQQPRLAEAMKNYSNRIPEEKRFLSEDYRKPLLEVGEVVPSCKIFATKEGMSWEIKNALSAEYQCTMGTYVETGLLKGAQLVGSKKVSSAIECKILTTTTLSGTRIAAPKDCAASFSGPT